VPILQNPVPDSPEPAPSIHELSPQVLRDLARQAKAWARELGFAELRIADADLSAQEPQFQAWLAAGFHGEMDYMAAHGSKRTRPAELVPGTVRVLSARMDYLPVSVGPDWREREQARLAAPGEAVISVYARGRDYHKVMRQRLQQLAERIAAVAGPLNFRAFTDSAPVMEVALADKSGLGWRGKHTLLLNREAGSMFFLGEIYTDLPLPLDEAVTGHCGQCSACIDVCPTQAILGPYKLDARRCISYLTIELKGSIPEELRPLIGNRVLGCDDCQLACPWNKFAQRAVLPDFEVRNELDRASLLELFAWTEDEFNRKLEGSAIRRIGHERWLRNIAVALGNAAAGGMQGDLHIVQALREKLDQPSELVREHVQWALARHLPGRDEQAQSVSMPA
jgi:epoxyqueuosine reductase